MRTESTTTGSLKRNVIEYVHSTPMDTRIKEINYKLLTKYYVPSKSRKIHLDLSPLRWRSCGGQGTHAHIWWGCPLIQPYWKEVLSLIKMINNVDTRHDPWQSLFHASGESRKNYRTDITPFFC